MTRYAEIEKAAQGVLDYFEEYFPTVLDPLRAALALPEDSKVVNAGLYGLAVALADSAARSDIECLCVRTGADRRTYTTDAVRNADKPEVAMAARYLELREQSGEPMPYRVVRDGDKVRFL